MVWWGSGSSGALLIPPEAWCIVCLGKVNSISDVKAGFYSCVLEHAAHKIHVTVVDLIFGVHPKTRDAKTSAEKCAHHIMGCATVGLGVYHADQGFRCSVHGTVIRFGSNTLPPPTQIYPDTQ